MDSNKLLIGFVVLVVAFLGFPIVANKMKAQNTTATATGTATAGVANTAVAAAQTQYPELKEPPLLNEGNLVGTEWQVQVEQYKVKVTIAAGGIAYATHPMAKALTGMDYVEGRWRLQHDKFFVNANLGGNDLSLELRIAGAKVYSLDKKGKPTEVKRF
jgi:hypothetical protein